MVIFGSLGRRALGQGPVPSKSLSVAASEAKDTANVTSTAVTSAALSASEAKDTAAFNAAVTAEVTIAVTEAQDIASFAATFSDGTISFAVTEAQDVVSFVTVGQTDVALLTTEAQDVASFAASAQTIVELVATEAQDSTVFNSVVEAFAALEVTEAQDVAAFRSFNIPVYDGNTWIIRVLSEQRTITVSTADDTISRKRENEYRHLFVPSEKQRISVRQTTARRREYQ